MFTNQASTCAAPKMRHTKAVAVATLIPVVAGAAVAVSTPAQAADSHQSPQTRAASSAAQAKKMRALKVKRSDVFVVGDSLTVGSKQSIRSGLKRQTRSVAVNAQVGRYTPAGISLLRSGQAKRAEVWVVALGTNDGPNAGIAKKNVRKVMKMAGNRQVVWLTIVRPGKYDRVNTALKQMDRRYSNLTVADWAQVVKKNKRLLSGDRVHMTAYGYKVRGKYVAQTVVNVAGR